MDPKLLSAIGAAGAAGDSTIGVEDVFKTYLYTGNQSARSINTGLNMTEGGLVWTKTRNEAANHYLGNTESGVNKLLRANTDAAESSTANSITAFNNNGFSLGSSTDTNWSNKTYVSWSFKKQKKFFTIATWQGDGTTSRTINHDLGSIPGCIIIKRTDAAGTWIVYHRGLADHNAAYTYAMQGLDTNSAKVNYSWLFQSAPTATSFEIGSGDYVNYNTGGTQGQYVAYLFAHEEAEFGPNSDQKIISCGSYTGNGSTDGPAIDLGFEVGYILLKQTNTNGNHWMTHDAIRGIATDGNDAILEVNETSAEWGGASYIAATPTGFKLETDSASHNGSGSNYIYIAIAAETGKTSKVPENGTDVFAMDTGTGSGTETIPDFDTTFPVDFALSRNPTSTGDWYTSGRLIQTKYLLTQTSGAQASGSWAVFDSNLGWGTGFGSSMYSWMWKRNAGFDVVTYKGNGGTAGGRQITHSLGQKPQMMWIKHRGSSNYDWTVYHEGLDNGSSPEEKYLTLNENYAEGDLANIWNDMAPTSSHFIIGSNDRVNNGSQQFIAILFASVDKISKLGYFTGDGTSNRVITTGFQPRMLIIRPVDTAENWWVLDTTRGWGSGDDKFLKLDTSDAQATYDFGAPTSTGFNMGDGTVTNANNLKYIYYCHA